MNEESEAIAPPLRALMELFATELAEVRFPDVDVKVLGEAAARVRERAEAVSRAAAALEAARQALHESQEALLHKGQRALAYARVYAEEDGALSAKLEAIALPRPARKPGRPEGAEVLATVAEAAPPKRRGRPPKARASEAPLFNESSAAEGSEAELSNLAQSVRPAA
jgi:ATP-dependent Clp protease ATP-binding subunit ClpA